MSNAMNKVNIIPQDEPAALVPVTPMDMLNRAVQSGADISMIEKLMNLQERWEIGQARKMFDAAVAKAKTEIPVIARNATGHNAKKYADFAAIAGVVDPILGRHGLSYRFRTIQTDKAITVTCVLFGHGHSEENTLTGPPDNSGNKSAIHSIGSTLTYLQRYSLVQMLGLAAAADDDGKTATVAKTITQKQADELRDLIEVNSKSRPDFMKWAKVEKIEDIAADRYDTCVAAIKFKAPAK